MPALQATAAVLHACAGVGGPVKATDCTQLRHNSSVACYAVSASSSRSLEAEILANVDSVLSSNSLQAAAAASSSEMLLNPAGPAQAAAAAAALSGVHLSPADPAQAAAAAASSGMHLNSAGTAQPASASQAERAAAAGEVCGETEDRLKVLLQGRGLHELAALLSSEESEVESDFSDDSGSGSGNGSGDGTAQGSDFSSCIEQDQDVGQAKVWSQLGLDASHVRPQCTAHCNLLHKP